MIHIKLTTNCKSGYLVVISIMFYKRDIVGNTHILIPYIIIVHLMCLNQQYN
jgi:hypothetical protein